MSQTLQLEETVRIIEPPRFLVQWSSPWQDFKTSIRPALARSNARLAGEAPYGIFPYRGMLPSMLMEAFLIFTAIVVRVKIEQLRPHVVPRVSSHDVIYYSGDELPRTEDLGGAQSGTSGRAGGQEAYHRTQTIKIARGNSLGQQIVDAPDLKLPSSRDAVANLLAVKPNPGPPPSEGLRAMRKTLTLPTPVIAPAPNVIRDYTRNGMQMDAVIAPAPTPQRDPFRSAPNLSATVIPPAPGVNDSHTLVAPSLTPTVIAPAPRVGRNLSSAVASLNPNVVAPAPTVASNQARSAPTLSGSVIPPAPGAVSRQISSAPVEMNMAVVPPPASAPERTTSRDPKVSLPSPSVIAPPPSTDISQDMRRLASGSIPDSSKSVVPPPPTQSGSGSYVSSLLGKIFGASEVVPPPPTVHSDGERASTTAPSANVVPPPPAVSNSTGGGSARGSRSGVGSVPGTNVIAPPPSAGISGGSGNRSVSSSAAPTLGVPSVVPPPPSLAGSGGGTGQAGGGNGAAGGTLLADNVVPPPPSVGGGSGANGSGLGRRGVGQGAPMEVGAPSSPASNGGSGNGAGAVISSQPGSKVGLPATGGKGSLALSPTGADKAGTGGSGGGTGIAHGDGSGSGLNGAGSGAGKAGSGRGSDPNARSGISLNSGPGGTGNGSSGTPAVPGVSVQGGSSIVTLPSFGSDPHGNSAPSTPARSSINAPQDFGVTIVATASSGGPFEPYKSLLKGQTYSVYFDTSLGQAVLQYGEGTASSYGGEASDPRPIRVDLPQGLPHERLVVACTLDSWGNLKNIRVLEPASATTTTKVVSAMHSWKFQPAMRGGQPVAVTAIIGFGIDTNDRF